jgi:hypothetical protein
MKLLRQHHSVQGGDKDRYSTDWIEECIPGEPSRSGLRRRRATGKGTAIQAPDIGAIPGISRKGGGGGLLNRTEFPADPV